MYRFLSYIVPVLISFNSGLLAMDEPFQCKVNLNKPHPSSEARISHAIITSLNNQKQAQLDAIQFAKEQETKKIRAAVATQSNQSKKISDGLQLLLKDTKLKDKEFNVDLIKKLPAGIQQKICQFIYSPSAFSNGRELLPALIPEWWYNDIIPLKSKTKLTFNSDPLDNPFWPPHHCHVNVIRISKDPKWFSDKTFRMFFTPRKYITPGTCRGLLINNTLYVYNGFVKKMLDDCSEEQLALVRTMYDRKNASRWIFSSSDAPVKLNNREMALYQSLPGYMQAMLETSYKAPRLTTAEPNQFSKTILTGLGCSALIAAAVWKFYKKQ